ncbi:MAG TPA: hypothetical protein VE078_06375, partial [Thermoanaerobaculia bacterium]|nr:hypothetical protein [Thermoanaerobaculia bacterium]
DLNLAYLYRGAADGLLRKGESKAALAAARTAARYAPNLPGTHANLGILEYLNGNPDAALDELRRARAADPKFEEQLRAALEMRSELKPLKEDTEFLARLFPPATGGGA